MIKKEVNLKVSEAFQQDVGYGRARIDHQTRMELDLSIGDVIEIEGKKKTASVVWRAHPTDEGKRIIRIDNLTRKNTGVGLGDNVTIKKADVKPARTVTLAPLISKGQQIQFGSGIEILIKKGLLKRPLTKGDNIIIPGIALFGSALPFAIINSNPSGIVSINEETVIKVKEEAAKQMEPEGPRVSYEDIGGLKDELERVKEMIQLPIKHPKIFNRLGIDPPKGVLLHGPPGTGKTLIAKAVANESGANFYTINGPEIMSKFYGQSEENLRKIFDEAEKNAPSIVFIDEIDAIAGKRSETHGEVEKRVVSQLLTLMDGLKGRGKLIVIGATNIPDSLDPALRRPGRFDREIRIDAPDRDGRKEIIQIHTRGMPIRPPFYPTIVMESWKERIEEINFNDLKEEITITKDSLKKTKLRIENLKENRTEIESKISKLNKKNDKILKRKESSLDKQRKLIEKERELKIELRRLNQEHKISELSQDSSNSNIMKKIYQKLMKKNEEIQEIEKDIKKIEEEIQDIESKKIRIKKEIDLLNQKIREIVEKDKKLTEERRKIEEKINKIENDILEYHSLRELKRFYKELKKNENLLQILYDGEKEIEHNLEIWGKEDPRNQITQGMKSYEDLLSKIDDEEIRYKLRKGFDPELKKRIENKSLSKTLKDIANRTYGYVGADLAALARESAMNALRRYLPEIDLDKPIPVEVLEKMEVTMDDFKNAQRGIEPSAMREFFVEVPRVSWKDVGGLEDVKQQLMESVEWPLSQPEVFKRLGINAPRGILLYGPPGTGKTLLAKAVANESDANFISIKGPEVMSKWVGESEKAVRELFKKAKQVAPSIVFLDELDAIAPHRGAHSGSHVTESVVNQLLTSVDGLESMEGVIIIGATNRPDIIDSSLLRPGRFDRLIMTPSPDTAAREEIFKIHTKNMPLGADVSLKELADDTDGFSGADIEALCRESAMIALRDNIKVKKVKKDHFTRAMHNIRASLTDNLIEYYKKVSKQLGSGIAKKDKRDKDIQYM